MSKTKTETETTVIENVIANEAANALVAPSGLDEAAALALMAGEAPTNDFKAGDTIVPYLQIVQSTSAYVKRADAAFIPEAREGDILDTLSLKLRSEAFVIPVKFDVTYTEWKPNQGGIVKQHGNDATAYNAAVGEYGAKTTAAGTEIVPYATYWCLLLDGDGGSQPVLLSLKGTEYKKSRRWNGLLSTEMRGPDGKPFIPPYYARVFKLTTVPESNDQGSWSGWRVEPNGLTLALPEGLYLFEKAKAFRESIVAGTARAAQNHDEPQARSAAATDPNNDIPF
jgi:hypothetical protein